MYIVGARYVGQDDLGMLSDADRIFDVFEDAKKEYEELKKAHNRGLFSYVFFTEVSARGFRELRF